MSNEIVCAQYVYITVPKSDIVLYHRIMSLMADYGEAKLKDCTAECLRNNQLVINAFNMFNAAIAAKSTNTKLYNTLIKYVEATIDNLYKGEEEIPSFIYEADFDGNVIIDLENHLLITQDGQYTIGEYTPPRVISNIRYEFRNVSFSYNKAESSGGIVSPIISYNHYKITEYEDGGEDDEILENNNVSLVFSSDTLSVDEEGKVIVSSSQITTEHDVGTVRLTLATKTPQSGYVGAEYSTNYTIQQKKYEEPNQLYYFEIPITLQERKSIYNTPSTVVNYVTTDKLNDTTKVKELSNYPIADNSIITTNDVINVTGRTTNNYIQVFLIKKTHTLVGYDDLGGSSQTLYQVDIEQLNTYPNVKAIDNNFIYNNKEFKAIYLLDNQVSLKSFKIQIKNQ